MRHSLDLSLTLSLLVRLYVNPQTNVNSRRVVNFEANFSQSARAAQAALIRAFSLSKKVACEQAPGDPEGSEGTCRHSSDVAVP